MHPLRVQIFRLLPPPSLAAAYCVSDRWNAVIGEWVYANEGIMDRRKKKWPCHQLTPVTDSRDMEVIWENLKVTDSGSVIR